MRWLFSFCFSFTDFKLEAVSKAFHITFECFASVVPMCKLLSAQLSKTLVNRCLFY